MIATAREKVRKEMTMEKEQEMMGRNKSWIHRYKTVKKRREKREIIRMKSFKVLKQVDVEV
ncbi:hypothetical protein PMIN06_009077 [Paraphaeosphaeria minitans]